MLNALGFSKKPKIRPMVRSRISGVLGSAGSFFLVRRILGCLGSLMTTMGSGEVVSTLSEIIFGLFLTLTTGVVLGVDLGVTLRVSVGVSIVVFFKVFVGETLGVILGVVLGGEFSASSAVVFGAMPPETIASTSLLELSFPTAFTAFLDIFSSSLGCR